MQGLVLRVCLVRVAFFDMGELTYLALLKPAKGQRDTSQRDHMIWADGNTALC